MNLDGEHNIQSIAAPKSSNTVLGRQDRIPIDGLDRSHVFVLGSATRRIKSHRVEDEVTTQEKALLSNSESC